METASLIGRRFGSLQSSAILRSPPHFVGDIGFWAHWTSPPKLTGIVEVDETYVLESQKKSQT